MVFIYNLMGERLCQKNIIRDILSAALNQQKRPRNEVGRWGAGKHCAEGVWVRNWASKQTNNVWRARRLGNGMHNSDGQTGAVRE